MGLKDWIDRHPEIAKEFSLANVRNLALGQPMGAFMLCASSL
jgi:hypothetical protein